MILLWYYNSSSSTYVRSSMLLRADRVVEQRTPWCHRMVCCCGIRSLEGAAKAKTPMVAVETPVAGDGIYIPRRETDTNALFLSLLGPGCTKRPRKRQQRATFGIFDLLCNIPIRRRNIVQVSVTMLWAYRACPSVALSRQPPPPITPQQPKATVPSCGRDAVYTKLSLFFFPTGKFPPPKK